MKGIYDIILRKYLLTRCQWRFDFAVVKNPMPLAKIAWFTRRLVLAKRFGFGYNINDDGSIQIVNPYNYDCNLFVDATRRRDTFSNILNFDVVVGLDKNSRRVLGSNTYVKSSNFLKTSLGKFKGLDYYLVVHSLILGPAIIGKRDLLERGLSRFNVEQEQQKHI